MKKYIIVFTGGEYPALCSTHAFIKTIGKPLFVIASDSGLVAAEQYGAKPDIIIGDFDSIPDMSLLEKYPKEAIKTLPRDKDMTDTEAALDYARSKSSTDTSIILIGGSGGRVDHFLGIYDLFSTPLAPDVWLCSTQALFHIRGGGKINVGCLKKDDCVSIARTTNARTGGKISSSGLMWESNVFRKEGMPSISNRISDSYLSENKAVEINVAEGDFVLIVPLSAKVTFL